MFDILLALFKSLLQIYSSLTEDQKDSICKAFTDLMEDLFRTYYKANSGGAQ